MEWRTFFKQNALNGAEDYIRSNSVRNLTVEGNQVTAEVMGIENFHVEIQLRDDVISSMKCSCPYAKTGSNCEHMAAAMLAWESFMKAEPDAESVPTAESVTAEIFLPRKKNRLL